MICPVCGGELDGPHVRFHHAPPYLEPEGHYVNEKEGLPAGGRLSKMRGSMPSNLVDGSYDDRGTLDLDLQLPPVRKKRENRDLFRARAFAWMHARASDSRQAAPPPGEAPPKPWPLEDTARWTLMEVMGQLGYTAHNLEQGHRPDGGHSRVTKGLPDVYFTGHGYRGWIETKRWDNDQTPEQTAFMAEELENNGIYLLIYEPEQFVRWHNQPHWSST